MRQFIWVYLITRLASRVDCVYSAAKETEIRQETVLASSYDKISRPSEKTTINISLSFLAIDDLGIKSQKFQAAGWLTLKWEDSRLTWDPTTKDNIEEIFSRPDDIWKPELLVDNSMDQLGVINEDHLYLRIKYDGTVEWEPPRLFITYCEVDITYYPYDRQKCRIDIASWGFTSNEVALEKNTVPVSLTEFERNGEWKIKSTNVISSHIEETLADGTIRRFPQLKFLLNIERRSEYYNLNVVMPIIVTSLLVSLTFVVPVDCGEKLSYIVSVFLAITVLLTLVAKSIPSTSITTSILGLYLALVTLLSAFGILVTVIIMILFKKSGSPKSGSSIMKIARVAAKVTCSVNIIGNNERKNRVSPTSDDETEDDVMYEVTWKDVARVLDRLCFIVFTIMTILMNFSFVISLVAGGRASEY